MMQTDDTHVITIRCSPDLFELIERAAVAEGLSLDYIVRRSVMRDLQFTRDLQRWDGTVVSNRKE